MTEIVVNGIPIHNNITTAKKTISEATKQADTARPQITDLPRVVPLGRDLVSQPQVLKAGEPYLGKCFDVQALGSAPIEIEEVTKDNVSKYQKYIDIWYQGDKETTKEIKSRTGKNPKNLHPKVGESIQHYGLEPMCNPWTTKDPRTIAYARRSGLTQMTKDPQIIKNAIENGWAPKGTEELECFVNVYNGDKAVIENTYTNAKGQLLKDAGGIKGKIEGTPCKNVNVILPPLGTRVKPLNDEAMKIVGIGDIVCCSSKKGKPINDWYVKPVSEFLKTAKANAQKGNTELIEALTNFVKNGGKDAKEWAKILRNFA